MAQPIDLASLEKDNFESQVKVQEGLYGEDKLCGQNEQFSRK